MTFVVVLLVAAVLTVGVLWFAGRGASKHQEELNTRDSGGENVEPRGQRPADADADAEPMGVEGPGQPGIRPPGD